MTDELRAACKRLRRYNDACTKEDKYHCYTEALREVYGDCPEAVEMRDVDRMELADAFIADHTEQREAQRREMVEKLTFLVDEAANEFRLSYVLIDNSIVRDIIALLTEPTP